MYFTLLLISFIAATLSLFRRHETRNGPYTAIRLAFIQSLILHGLFIFVYNEIFSALNLITPLTARLYWFFVALVVIGWLSRSLGAKSSWQQLRHQLGSLVRVRTLDGRSRFLLYIGLVLIIIPLLILAVYTPLTITIRTSIT
ncbi:hypothetical protein [Spirosoma sp. KNUC1025]|uniref:hypothetical protein n=1 Tax=Spirosoma sp. KNUC1025 TaxID=2894082 RepID=UPI00386ECBD4|nr:hypothetical protein LN737_16315 [Spirosoma sp. KNUC1025]